MANNDIFDLDIQVQSVSGQVGPQITSVSACTPGSCYQGCQPTSTFASNCCPTAYTVCITATCVTCA